MSALPTYLTEPNWQQFAARLLAGLLRGDYYRGQAHAKRLEPLPLGGPTSPPTIAYWGVLLLCFLKQEFGYSFLPIGSLRKGEHGGPE